MNAPIKSPAAWLRKNALWLMVNGIALFALISLVSLAISNGTASTATQIAGPGGRGAGGLLIHVSGEQSQRFLLASLAMTPLHIVFGWYSVLGLKKSTGLWAFIFTALHLVFYAQQKGLTGAFTELELLVGTIALLIMLPLALTSTSGWMKRMGKGWTALHRTVYVAGVLAAVHTALVGHGAPVDLIIVSALLATRIPAVRHWFVTRRQRPQLSRAAAPAGR
jgi:methionine sulfoxide reductase heme-binding subunit